MAKKRRKTSSYDIRPKNARIQKSWASLSSSTKSYWRSKLDVRPASVRRSNPLDRIRTSTARAQFTRDEYLTSYQRRIVRDTGVRYRPERSVELSTPTPEIRLEAEEAKKEPPTYGYDLDDFLKIRDHPDGYSYVTYHIFLLYRYKGQKTSGQFITYRGQQYNTVDDLKDGIADDIYEAGNDVLEDTEGEYVRTIVAVIPASGAERVGGAVYPRDYHPKERPGTREHEVEEGKKRLRGFGPPLR